MDRRDPLTKRRTRRERSSQRQAPQRKRRRGRSPALESSSARRCRHRATQRRWRDRKRREPSRAGRARIELSPFLPIGQRLRPRNGASAHGREWQASGMPRASYPRQSRRPHRADRDRFASARNGHRARPPTCVRPRNGRRPQKEGRAPCVAECGLSCGASARGAQPRNCVTRRQR